jgi:hypothetical protein
MKCNESSRPISYEDASVLWWTPCRRCHRAHGRRSNCQNSRGRVRQTTVPTGRRSVARDSRWNRGWKHAPPVAAETINQLAAINADFALNRKRSVCLETQQWHWLKTGRKECPWSEPLTMNSVRRLRWFDRRSWLGGNPQARRQRRGPGTARSPRRWPTTD